MYAVIDDRGNQIKVSEGEVVTVDLADAEPGSEVVFERVLLVSDDSGVKIGRPVVQDAKVIAEVIGNVKGKKVYGVSFRRRKSSRVRKGHRQKYTKVRIKEIKA
jgi:large subunit ribosomal protein L21